MNNLVRILMADDQVIVRNGIRFMLETQDQFKAVLTEVQDGSEVLGALHSGSFDLVLMDIQMSKLDGISTVRKLREKNIQTPVLFISVYEDPSIIRQVMDCGANGFILKSCGLEELLKAITTVIGGDIYYSNEIAQAILGNNQKSKRAIGLKEALTNREWEILKLLAEDYSNEEIALKLDLSKRTIETHKQNIKTKLQVKTTIGIVRFAYQNGHIT